MTDAALPEDFADLAPWLDWALPTENARRQRRLASSHAEMCAFFEAVFPRMQHIADHLAPFPPDAVPQHALALYRLALAFADVAPYVEYYKAPQVPDSFDEMRFVALHGEVPN